MSGAYQPSKKRMRRLLARYKCFVGCAECGYRRSARALDYHHRPGVVKSFGLRHAWKYHGSERIRAEMRKCIVLCSNCHAEHHEAADAARLR